MRPAFLSGVVLTALSFSAVVRAQERRAERVPAVAPPSGSGGICVDRRQTSSRVRDGAGRDLATLPGDLGRLYRFVPGVATSEFYHYIHTDQETPDTVPWTGLEASTRAYARIIDEVNPRDLAVLQRPPGPEP